MNEGAAPEVWSIADPSGIQSRVLDAQHRRRLRRSALPAQKEALSGLPTDWRELLTSWLRGVPMRRSWQSLLKIAGNVRYGLAVDLLQTLLESGWIQLDERRHRDRWEPRFLTWITPDDLRQALGLQRIDARAALRDEALAQPPEDVRLQPLHRSLNSLAIPILLRRAAIIQALDHWTSDRRNGTRQQFALDACWDTKGLNSSDWRWLADHVDLDELGISRHTPALWVCAPLCLHRGDSALDLRLIPDMAGLTPLTLDGIDTITGDIDVWLLLENRTSFEQVAREVGQRQGVLWLPGFAPDWWLQTVARLLQLFPRPALIAADPDPAGIEIALRAGSLWREHGLGWQPWAMDIDALKALARHKQLNAYDRERLLALAVQDLPPALRGLAEAMDLQGIKGEQEGIDLVARLPTHLTSLP